MFFFLFFLVGDMKCLNHEIMVLTGFRDLVVGKHEFGWTFLSVLFLLTEGVPVVLAELFPTGPGRVK